MALEYRNGKPCYYRKLRHGNKVVSQYIGQGHLAFLAAETVEMEKLSRKAERESKLKEQALHRAEESKLYTLEQSLKELFTRVALANGYHQHKREWRKNKKKYTRTDSGSSN